MVALLTGVSTDRLASVSRLFVSPVARGRGLGLGTSLLAAVSSWTSAHDFRLMLDVVDDGAPAIRLYERIGWCLVDRRQVDWVTPQGERLPVRIYLAPESE
jgi:GNAT superfamily N-acetyltransferase